MKANTILVVTTVLLLTAMSVMSFIAKRQAYENLLLVTPSAFGARGQSLEKLEELSEEEFLLTYELRQTATAQAINSIHTVTMIGTNQNYANIMGYVTLDGGFFTKDAWVAKNKHAVLNETAAFQIFGSEHITGQILKLNGEAWVVTGVIQDNDAKSSNVYVPSSLTGGQALSLMVLMDDKDITEAYVKNALKSISIHDDNYDFINLSKSTLAFGQRLSVALKSALLVAILLFVFKTGGRLMQNLRFYRKQLSKIYFRELLIQHRVDIMKTIAGIILFAIGTFVIIMLSLGILETCLTLKGIVHITGEHTVGDFGVKLVWLRDYSPINIALFAACIGAIMLYFLLSVKELYYSPNL